METTFELITDPIGELIILTSPINSLIMCDNTFISQEMSSYRIC